MIPFPDFTPVLFYVGATLAIGSYAIRNVLYLRITAMLACTMFALYYYLTSDDVKPLISNLIIILINLSFVIHMLLNRKEWKAFQRYKRIHRARKKRKKTE